MKLTGGLVSDVSLYAPLTLGRDVTAFGVTLTSTHERAGVAERLRELSSRPIGLAHKVVLPARKVVRHGIRQLISAALL